MIASRSSRSAVTDTMAGKRLPSFADVGQFVDVLDPARGLKTRASKPGVIRRGELSAQCLGARDQFLRSEMSAGVILSTTSAAGSPACVRHPR